MRHKNVDYKVVKPYKIGIHHEDFVDKFMKSKLNKKLKVNREALVSECHRSGYRPTLSLMNYSNNDIIKPLHEFLKSTKKTRKRRIKNKKTRKKKGGKKCYFWCPSRRAHICCLNDFLSCPRPLLP